MVNRTNNPSSPNFNRPVRRTPQESAMTTNSKSLIERFQELHINKYGIEISYEVAEHQLKELAELVRLTSKMEALK
jgi:hypothetical protein